MGKLVIIFLALISFSSFAQGGSGDGEGGPGITLLTTAGGNNGTDGGPGVSWNFDRLERLLNQKGEFKEDVFIPQDTVDIGLLDGTVMDKESLIDAYGSELIQFTGRGMRVNKHIPIKDYQTRDGVIHETKWFQKSTSDDADDYSYPYND